MSAPSLEATRALVEQAIRGFGLDPQKVLAKSDDDEASWTFRRGSANVVVSLARGNDGTCSLRVAAPVVVPPEDASKRSALYEHLLTLNASGLANAAFALLPGDEVKVIAVSQRPTEGLGQAEVEQMIKHLSAVADTYDDRLVAKFGGKRASEA